MRRLAVLIVVMFSLAGNAQGIGQRFQSAVRLYEQGEYKKAENLLEPLVKTFKRTDGAILYNLAATELKLGKPGKALYYLLLARRSSNPEVRDMATAGIHRLRLYLTKQQAMQKSAMQRYLFQPYHDYLSMAVGWVDQDLALWLGVAFWVLGLVFLTVYRAGRRNPWMLKTAITLIFMAFVSAGLYSGRRYMASHYRIGVVIRDADLFKSMDSLEARETIPEGLEIRVIKRTGNLVHIRMVGGKAGFIDRDNLMILPTNRTS